MASVSDDKNSNFLWFPNFYIAINIYIKENSTAFFHLFKLLGLETSRYGPATAPGPPTLDWGGTDVREKQKKNAFC